jgi:UDP-N-acetylglucosamine--N-acetylmuramyl-(pentapeptide) pyrophosphoryl-undecaprenol N-acetylglucosamine transferase
MAQLLNIPTLIQEQNSYAGITNKWLAKRAKLVCVAYPEMQKAFPAAQVLFTGNPVRQSLTKVKSRYQGQDLLQLGFEPNKPLILAIGGSLGARTINLALLQHHQAIIASGMQLLWQTGKSGYESTIQKLQVLYPNGLPQQLQVKEFIVDMDTAYSAATVVISRAGALSISELALVGKPAILVPSPNVAEDHQTKNAMALVRLGAAVMIKDQDLNSQLINQLKSFFDHPKSLNVISEAISQQAKPNAASDIAAAIIKLKTFSS